MTTLLCEKGELIKSGLKISYNGDRRSNTYMQAPFKKKK